MRGAAICHPVPLKPKDQFGFSEGSDNTVEGQYYAFLVSFSAWNYEVRLTVLNLHTYVFAVAPLVAV